MTDVLNATPPNTPHLRPISPHTAAGMLNLQGWGASTQTATYMGFSYPGPISPIGPTVCWTLPRNYSGYVYMITAALGTADSGGYDMFLGYWLNGQNFAELVIPAGNTIAVEGCSGINQWPIPGTLTDVFQVSVDTYAGSSAADLTWHIHAF